MTQPITAYHGSNREVKQFSTDHVGTRQPQPKVWGLSFSSSVQVAKHYRNLGENPSGVWVGDRLIPKATVQDIREKNQRHVDYLAAVNLEIYGYEDAKTRFQNDRNRSVRLGRNVQALSKRAAESTAFYDSVLTRLEDWKDQPVHLQNGRVYQVALAPADNQYLDWNTPLRDQSSYVRDQLQAAGWDTDGRSGYELYQELQEGIRDNSISKEHPAHRRIAEIADIGYDLNRCTPAEIASRYLHSLDIPGIRYRDSDRRSVSVGQTGYIVFDDNQVSITTQFQRRRAAFYSPLEKILETELPVRDSAQVYLDIVRDLQREGRLNSEELNWYGLPAWLDNLANSSEFKDTPLQRSDVLNYLMLNHLQVVPVEKDIPPGEKQSIYINEVSRRLKEVFQRVNALDDTVLETIRSWATATNHLIGMQTEKRLADALMEAGDPRASETIAEIQDAVLKEHDNRQIRFESHAVVNGGRDYGEMLLTLPELHKPVPDVGWLSSIRTWEASWPDPKSVGSHDGANSYGQVIDRIQASFADIKANHPGRRSEFPDESSSLRRWVEPNVLADMQFDVRESNGDKTLFVHGVDSYWHTLGQLSGYRDSDPDDRFSALFAMKKAVRLEAEQEISDGKIPPQIARIEKRRLNPGSRFETEQDVAIYKDSDIGERGSREELIAKLAERIAEDDPRVVALQRQATLAIKQVDDAPFKTTWPLLAMKQMLHVAVQKGCDKLAWAPGQRVADALEESIHVAEVQYDPDGEELTIWGPSRDIVLQKCCAGREGLIETLGPELAQRLWAQVEEFQQHREGHSAEYDDDEGKYVIYDPNGDLSYGFGGTLLTYDTEKEAEQGIVEITPADATRGTIPTLKNLDCKIGGQEIIDLYDTTLPDQLRRYVEPFDCALTQVCIGSGQDAMTAQCVEINDALRESISRGQPLFRRLVPMGAGRSAPEVSRDIQGVVERLGIPATVVARPEDLPWRLRNDLIKARGFNDTAGLMDGLTGRCYLIAGQLCTPKEAIVTYLHEVGHQALCAATGPRLHIVLDQLYRDMPADRIKAISNDHRSEFKNMSATDVRRRVAAEWAAEISQEDPKNTWVQTVVSAIKDLIRSVAPRVKWTESDVVALLKKGTARLRVPDPFVAVDSSAPDVVENHRLNSLEPTDIAAWKHRGSEHEPVNNERPHLPSAVTAL